jgi:hypothetical protein
VKLLFSAVGLVPQERVAKVVEASVTWNYTTVLNLVFLAVRWCWWCGSCVPAARRC